jgi:hypothetical protein
MAASAWQRTADRNPAGPVDPHAHILTMNGESFQFRESKSKRKDELQWFLSGWLRLVPRAPAMAGMSFSALGRIARPALLAPGAGQAEHALPRPAVG